MMDINREQALILVSDGLMMNDHNGKYVTTDVGVKAFREYITRMSGDNKDV